MKSEVFAWGRFSYLSHVVLLMGRIKKENFQVNPLWIGCIARHERHNFVFRLTSLCMVVKATFEIKHWKWKGMQEIESNMSILCRWKVPTLGITVWHNSAKPRDAKQNPRDGIFYPYLTPM